MPYALFVLVLAAGAAQAAEPAPVVPAPAVPARPLFAPTGQAPAVNISNLSAGSFAASQDGITSFMYFGPTQWSFWWRGQRVTPTTVPDDITELQIDSQRVLFLHDGQEYRHTIGKFN